MIKEEISAQKQEEKKKIEEAKRLEFQNQLARLEHVKRKIEKQRREDEERDRQQNIGVLHWQAKVRCLFISNIIEFSEIKDKAEKFIDPNVPFRLRVKNITKIRLEAELLKEREEYIQTMFNPRRKVMKFYGNSIDTISDVISTGRFFPSNKLRKEPQTGIENTNGERDDDILGCFGYGVYFTTDANASLLHCGKRGTTTKYLLYCEVNIGNTLPVSEADVTFSYNELTERGYDSVYASRDVVGNEGIFYEQFVAYHPFQALPVYLIECEEVFHNVS